MAKASKANKDASKIDAAGTAPGLPEHTRQTTRTVSMKCRFQGCDGSTAIEVLGASTGAGAPSNRLYQCSTCSGTWGVPVGGLFPY